MSFLQNKNNDEKPKRRSTLGFLFNPEIGNDIKPLGESIAMFVRLIAMLFVANGLFPKNHPALTDTKIKLTMREVIGISYRGLSFTKEGLPQVLLFAAVVGILGFSVLFVVTFALSLMVGRAHAADSMFVLPNKNAQDCDIADALINYMFLAKEFNLNSNCNSTGMAVPNITAVQNVLQNALAYFSSGVLVFAGVILLYHLLSMIAETAHTGKPMGKANQIWAPIRLVLAIGLLVPIGAGGLNTGQYVVIQMARWGSAFASNTWRMFLDGMANKSDGYGALYLRSAPYPDATANIINIVQMEACRLAYNRIIDFSNTKGTVISSDYLMDYPQGVKIENSNYTGVPNVNPTTYNMVYSFVSRNKDITCGSLEFPQSYPKLGQPTINGASINVSTAAFNTAAVAIYKAQYDAITDLLDKQQAVIDKAAESIYDFIPAYQPSGWTTRTSVESMKYLEDIKDSYQSALNAALTVFMPNSTGGWKDDLTAISSNFGNLGWVTAGAWFNTIARAQGAILDTSDAAMPVTSPAKLSRGLNWDSLNFLSKQTKHLQNADEIVEIAMNNFNEKILSHPSGDTDRLARTGTDANNQPDIFFLFKWLFKGIDKLANIVGVWNTDAGGLGFAFDKAANPFGELAYVGYKFISLGLNLIAIGGAGTLATTILGGIAGSFAAGAGSLGTGAPIGAIMGGAAAGMAGGLMSILFLIGASFVAAGVMLAYMIPLIPFIRFFFNILTWLVMLFEAVVSAPLLALAHVTPDGDGLPGNMARGGYFFILGIFLRPILMVFGLVAGLIMFLAAINLLNMTFNVAIAGTGATTGSFSVLSKIIFSMMYVGFVYICANTSFKMISHFPEHALRWMNASSPPGEKMGDRAHMGTIISAATGYMGGRLGETMKSTIGGMASGGQNVLDKYKGGIAAKNAKADQAALMDAIAGRGGGGSGGNASSGLNIIGQSQAADTNANKGKNDPKKLSQESRIGNNANILESKSAKNIRDNPNYKAEEGKLIATNTGGAQRTEEEENKLLQGYKNSGMITADSNSGPTTPPPAGTDWKDRFGPRKNDEKKTDLT